jgi:hypothetical protein
MRTNFQVNSLRFVFLAAAFLGSASGGWATRVVTFTNTPAAISNTYTGVITLQIAGLTNGEQVAIQDYLDLNGNGSVDAGEPLICAFKITDGGANVIGGITNLNVPFDSDPSPGSITATLNFAPPLTMANVVGQQLFLLVSPSNHFPPLTNVFQVTNAAPSPSITGTVFNGSSPVPFGVVVALQSSSRAYTGAAVADGSGHYALSLSPGTYQLMAAGLNVYCDLSLVPPVTLTNGAVVNANLYVTNGTATISGRVYDSGNSNGVGGLLVVLKTGSLTSVSFTDTNGNYNASVSPAQWGVEVDSSHLIRGGFVVPQNDLQINTTTGSVANADFPLTKGNALFYGRITNTFDVPFANVDVYANDNIGLFQADGFSDPNGYYTVAVLGGTNWWNCSPDIRHTPTLAGYLVSASQSTNISPGQALQQDFTVTPVTAQITGQVQDNQGNPITNLSVNAWAVIGQIQFGSSGETDGAGNYALAAASGTWNVNLDCCSDSGLASRGLTDLGYHTVSIPPTNAVMDITVYPIGTPMLSQPIRLSPSRFGFNLIGTPGYLYTIQASSDLCNWVPLISLALPPNQYQIYLEDPLATNASRFYRVETGP